MRDPIINPSAAQQYNPTPEQIRWMIESQRNMCLDPRPIGHPRDRLFICKPGTLIRINPKLLK